MRLTTHPNTAKQTLTEDKINLELVKNHDKKEDSIWIDYKEAHDMVLLSWIIDCVNKISDKIIKFITEAMKNWKVKLATGRKSLAELKIQIGLFQVNALSPLLFVVFWLLNTSSSNSKTNHDMWGNRYIDRKSIYKRETVSNKNIGLVIE